MNKKYRNTYVYSVIMQNDVVKIMKKIVFQTTKQFGLLLLWKKMPLLLLLIV